LAFRIEAVPPERKEEEEINPPELSPEQQRDVDHPARPNLPLMNGARVLALWGNDYYPAIVCE
jgi:hypothetical protein